MDFPFLHNIPVLLSGLFYLILVLFLFLYFLKRNINEQQGLKIIKIIIGFFVVLYFIYSVTRFLERDEIEHIQSAWLIFRGEVPYFDFFQHHHPLLWYITAPSFYFTGNGLAAVLFFRLI